jgi:hypothetical protein
LSLYKGSLPFLITHCLFVSFQFTIYEYILKAYKRVYGEDYEKKEFQANVVASFMGGAIGSAVTNSLDVLTINKQANPDLNIL